MRLSSRLVKASGPRIRLSGVQILRALCARIISTLKLVVAIIQSRDKVRVCDELVGAGFKSTVLGSSGGFLREGNTTLLVGVEDTEVEKLLQLIRENCHSRQQILNISTLEAATPGSVFQTPVEVPVGGAVVFVLEVAQFARF